MHSEKDIILIRHAQSTFNEATVQAMEDMKLYQGWFQLVKNEQFNRRVSYNGKYTNAELSAYGKQQCAKVHDKAVKADVGVILVSPYTRTLQTCQILFEGHPAPVIVEPLIAEIFNYSCDVVSHLEGRERKFPNFDFSKIKDQGDEWYLQYLSPKNRELIRSACEEHKAETTEQKNKVILSLITQKKLRQQYGEFRARINKAKQVMKSYRDKYGKVAVVAHYHTIQFLTAEKFTEDGDVLEYKGVENCTLYYWNLEELLGRG